MRYTGIYEDLATGKINKILFSQNRGQKNKNYEEKNLFIKIRNFHFYGT